VAAILVGLLGASGFIIGVNRENSKKYQYIMGKHNLLLVPVFYFADENIYLMR
jgi:hypothetical protein